MLKFLTKIPPTKTKVRSRLKTKVKISETESTQTIMETTSKSHEFCLIIVLSVLAIFSLIGGVVADTEPCGLIGYDLLNLTKATYWEIDWKEKNVCLDGAESCKFYFSFCKNLPMTVTPDGPKCTKSAVCTEVPPVLPKPKNASDTYYGLGDEISLKDVALGQFWANFSKGQPYHKPDKSPCTTSTILHFICEPSQVWIPNKDASKGTMVPKVRSISYVPTTCQYVISMEYAGACYTAAEVREGLSAGSVLIIMFICTFSVYLIGGATYNHCQGAQGKEMMPHLDFWEDLPKNIKAGCTFTYQMLTCQEIPTQSPTYEQL